MAVTRVSCLVLVAEGSIDALGKPGNRKGRKPACTMNLIPRRTRPAVFNAGCGGFVVGRAGDFAVNLPSCGACWHSILPGASCPSCCRPDSASMTLARARCVFRLKFCEAIHVSTLSMSKIQGSFQRAPAPPPIVQNGGNVVRLVSTCSLRAQQALCTKPVIRVTRNGRDAWRDFKRSEGGVALDHPQPACAG
jgi:hypothetical protein